jgi:hypothetical protein
MTNGQKLLAAFGAAALSFAAVAAVTLSQGTLKPILPDEAHLIFEMEGVGDAESSQPFQAPDNWQLRWDFDDRDKTATVLETIRWSQTGGESNEMVAMHRKPIRSGGGVYVAQGGEYRLSVKGKGPWRIRAYRFDELDKPTTPGL